MSGEPIRWIYPIVGGAIAEGVTIALTALVVVLSGHGAMGGDPVAQRIGAVMEASVGSLACYVMGWWAARRAGARFQAHGGLVGTMAAVLTALGAIYGPLGESAYYVVAVLMKILAGSAGGRMAERMAARDR
ncbi:MAG TPA: hypothetical protein VFB67_04700 [Candidatus Polarisedimenticolaceae bacterium]|nr:hypothetical protein [Candidatus Polarisedimenticolaceae bacterium]